MTFAVRRGRMRLALALLALSVAAGTGACGPDQTNAPTSQAGPTATDGPAASSVSPGPAVEPASGKPAAPAITGTASPASSPKATPSPRATATRLPTAAATPRPDATSAPVSGLSAAVDGLWHGVWKNLTFGTSGAAMVDIEVSAAGDARLTIDVDGPVFGLLDPPVREFGGTWNANGATFTAQSDDLLGDMRIRVTSDGALAMRAENIPGVGVRVDARGQISASGIEVSYTLRFTGGGSASGFLTLARGRVEGVDGQLLLRTAGGAEVKLLHLRELPRHWDPLAGGEAQGSQDGLAFAVDAPRFGPVALNSSGRRLAWSTAGATSHIAGVLDIASGVNTVTTFVHDGSVESLRWSPDGQHLAAALLTPLLPVVEVYRVDQDNVQKVSQVIAERLHPADGWATTSPTWRSERELAFLAYQGERSEAELWVLDVVTGDVRRS